MKKLCSLFLVFAMCLSMFPTTVIASDTEDEGVVGIVIDLKTPIVDYSVYDYSYDEATATLETESGDFVEVVGIPISWSNYGDDAIFEADTNYSATLNVEMPDGYCISDGFNYVALSDFDIDIIYISDIEIEENSVNVDINVEKPLIPIYYEFSPKILFTPPTAGVTANVEIKDSVYYELSDVEWSPELVDGKFEENTEYTATVYVQAKPGYVFMEYIEPEFLDIETETEIERDSNATYSLSYPNATIVEIVVPFNKTGEMLENEPVEKAERTLSFENEVVNAVLGDEPFILRVNDSVENAEDVYYISDDTSVATVNSVTGEVTILSVGIAVITAIADETETYKSASASYTLNVAEPDEPKLPEDVVVVGSPIALKELVYNGQEQELISVDNCTVEGGLLQYRLNDDEEWVDEIPVGINAGTYIIYWKVKGAEGYKDYVAEEPIEVVIDKAVMTAKFEKGRQAIAHANIGEFVTISNPLIGNYAGATVDISINYIYSGDYYIVYDINTLFENNEVILSIGSAPTCCEYLVSVVITGDECNFENTKVETSYIIDIVNPANDIKFIDVEFTTSEGGTVNGVNGTYILGKGIIVNAVPNEGYFLSHWINIDTNEEIPFFMSNDGDVIKCEATLMEAGTYKAIFEKVAVREIEAKVNKVYRVGNSAPSSEDFKVIALMNDRTYRELSSDEYIVDTSSVNMNKAGVYIVRIKLVEDENIATSTEVTVNAKPSSGNNRPSSKPTVTVSDKVETVVDADGVIIETRVKEDGSITEKATTPNGTVAITQTDTDGAVTIEVSVSDKETGAVLLPIDSIVVKENSADVVPLTVNAPSGADEVTITIPLDGINAGTVAIIVNPDGTETVIRDSVVADDETMTLTVADGTTLKFINNSRDFSDVSDNDWFKDAVDFASSHQLFNGTSETTFSPDTEMTRGMLAVVLHNLSNNPAASSEADFRDVNGQYFADAAAWAQEQGIINGYSDGTFGGNDAVTREQLAVMLYRFANMPSSEDAELSSSDAEEASTYSVSALEWASANGILVGDRNGNLMPKSDANRAQVATMLMRFCKNV